MSCTYILMSLFVILTNIPMLPGVVSEIMSDAFSYDSVGGGIAGFVMSRAVRVGVTRGIVSNEAGCGTAPIAHASSSAQSAAEQGIWGMVEVFVDTVVICTLTALTVLIAKRHGVSVGTDGMESAVLSYSRFIPLASLILAASVFIFAFCTVVCWFYYGSESLGFLTKSRLAKKIYLVIYATSAFMGTVMPSDGIWAVCDLVTSAMTAVNIVFVMLFIKEVKDETDSHFFVGKTKKH